MLRDLLRCAGLAAGLITLLGSSATAAFAPSFVVSTSGKEPQVAVDASGNALFAWMVPLGSFPSQGHTLFARARSAAGVLGPIQTVNSGSGVRGFEIAMDVDGNALVISFGGDLSARTISNDGVLGPSQTIASSVVDRAVTNPEIAMDSDGDALIVWQVLHTDTFRSDVQARFRSASGVLGPIETLSAPGGVSHQAKVAMNGSGNAVVAWGRGESVNHRKRVVQLRVRPAAGPFSATQTVSPPSLAEMTPDVDLDSGGNAIVVWRRSLSGSSYIQWRRRSAAGALSGALTVSDPTKRAFEPTVVKDANGPYLAAWRLAPSGPLQSAAAPGGQGSIENISPSGLDTPQLAMVNRQAVFAWDSGQILARTRRPNGLGPIQNLSSGNGDDPHVSMGGGGRAVVVWREDGQIRASVGP